MDSVIEFPASPKRVRTHVSRRPITYTIDEAAELLGISRSHAYNCVKAGSLPALKFGRRIVVPARAIESLLSAARATSGNG